PGRPLDALIEVSPSAAALTATTQPSRGGPDAPQSPRSPLSPDISRPRSVTTVIPPADARTPGRRLKGQEAERPEGPGDMQNEYSAPKRRGRLKGPLGSHDRPASALAFRLVLAVFGAAVLLAAALLAWTWAQHALLTFVFAAGLLASLLNVYWVYQRLRHAR